jgi:NAD(P)H-hydrate epimerase
MQSLDDALAAELVPRRDPRAHKGNNGRVLVVAGSLDYAGAGLLSSHAAGRAGAGLVTLAVPRSLQPTVAGRYVEVITIGLPETAPYAVDPAAALALIRSVAHDALVVGPGLRHCEATDALVRSLLAEDGVPAVVDAEALNVLAGTPGWPGMVHRPCVLTPHPGEFRRLQPTAEGDLSADDDLRERLARSAAREWRQVVVLKGARTVVADPGGEAARAPFENPALGTGGTGDVLAGTIGALLGQGLEPYAAARLGVYLHGAAGDAIRERLGDSGLLASDLPGEIALVRRRLASLRDRRAGGARRVGFSMPDEPA